MPFPQKSIAFSYLVTNISFQRKTITTFHGISFYTLLKKTHLKIKKLLFNTDAVCGVLNALVVSYSEVIQIRSAAEQH